MARLFNDPQEIAKCCSNFNLDHRFDISDSVGISNSLSTKTVGNLNVPDPEAFIENFMHRNDISPQTAYSVITSEKALRDGNWLWKINYVAAYIALAGGVVAIVIDVVGPTSDPDKDTKIVRISNTNFLEELLKRAVSVGGASYAKTVAKTFIKNVKTFNKIPLTTEERG
ncbi:MULTISPECIES: hypothetical protein [Lactobacillaceae]|jgi:hypothetical protein|uniref:hypothetical protein n=1 Tax=Lactobacillaceae TaxID=33958 RepID=UPI001F50E9E0|nr:hypothetical protein [Lacticaseibacillus paracasei]MCI0374431.1 hypothetical protein [Lacticaseibacillus paracasei]MCP9306198.1 hypothetical protein [Lacticaseibacillus paracasei]MCP9311632.1 hypothetical protein [Lacticaseibacillus paracasei]MCP9380330.1 hypothetical protein [Lacticaseibacillus paracasei]